MNLDHLSAGSRGDAVRALQVALNARGFPCGPVDGIYGAGTEAAVLAYQRSAGLLADGIAGPRTQAALGLRDNAALPSVLERCTVPTVSRMFPGTSTGNIERYLPPVLEALRQVGLVDKPMVLMALATIRAETAGFEPISEGKSRYNTSPNGHAFDLYDHRRDLGNRGVPDGERFRGRGFVQLTGRDNYTRFGAELGVDLVQHPELANDPAIAAQLLARFIKRKELPIKQALLDDDLRTARRLVNGGSHGLDRFTLAYAAGNRWL